MPVKTSTLSPPRHSIGWNLGLVGAAVMCLAGGALLAVSFQGAFRVLFALLGFAGYLFYFSRAFRDVFPRIDSDSTFHD